METDAIPGVIARRLRAVREDRRLSVRDLSAELEKIDYRLLPSGVSKIENGERQVSAADLVALAVALKVTPAALLVDLDAPRVAVTGAVDAAPLDVLIWLWGYGPLPGQDQRGGDFPHQAATFVRRIATVWMDTQTVEKTAAEQKDRKRYTEFLAQQRKALRELAQALEWSGVTVPPEIAGYLAKHGGDRG